MSALSFPKGSKEKLSEHFNAFEFDCHCSNCSLTLIDPVLIKRLEKLREILGARILLTSAYRCDYQQAILKAKGFETAKGRSTHQDGMAVDLRSYSRSGADLEIFAAEAGFCAIGVAKEWIHVDTRTDKLRRWTYGK